MKKEMRFTLWISLFIVALFGLAMGMTYVNDWLQAIGFFGDEKFVPYKNLYGFMVTEDGKMDTKWVWGARHFWYFWMCVLLFIMMVVRIVIWSSYYLSEK